MAIYSSHSSNSLGQYWIQIGFNLIELLSSRYDSVSLPKIRYKFLHYQYSFRKTRCSSLEPFAGNLLIWKPMASSIIYRHILIYRLVMNILYFGKYKTRFDHIINQLSGFPPNTNILELCFGDTVIAEYCKKAGYNWRGIDINTGFVLFSKKRGYDAYLEDLTIIDRLPKADACIMMGSLYHFHPNEFSLLQKILNSCDLLILSEPVVNLSSTPGIIGFLSRKATSVGKGDEAFRFKKSSLLQMLKRNSEPLNYETLLIEDLGKDLLIVIKKNEHPRN